MRKSSSWGKKYTLEFSRGPWCRLVLKRSNSWRRVCDIHLRPRTSCRAALGRVGKVDILKLSRSRAGLPGNAHRPGISLLVLLLAGWNWNSSPGLLKIIFFHFINFHLFSAARDVHISSLGHYRDAQPGFKPSYYYYKDFY